jgi:preprotein translocase subunit SecE
MNAKTDSTVNKIDIVKWAAAVIIFTAALVLNFYFSAIAAPIRVIGWIVIFAITLGLAAWTAQGKIALTFLAESRMELRKVVWPTMPETVQTTGMIIVMVLGFGLLMWGFDTLLMFIIGLLTGQRG